MASSVPCHPILTFLFPFLFLFLFSPSLSDVPTSSPIPPNTACSCTQDPNFCKSVVQPHGPDTIYGYTRFSLSRSLSNTYKLLDMINKWLASSPSLPEPAVQALEDCQLLLGLNIDFLLTSGKTLSSNSTLPDSQADTAHTYLSALLTNQETCWNGLQTTAPAGSITKDFSAHISIGTKLYSLSLALFTHAWVPDQLRRQPLHQFTTPDRIPRFIRNHSHGGRKLLADDHLGIIRPDDSLPLRMSRENSDNFQSRTYHFQSRTGHQLLDSSSSGSVLISDIVTVSQDGTGNFTNITDAVAAAPNNADGTQGFFLIYILAGLYNEYVSVPPSKKYLMMIGDGINQTIITGNRSAAGNWSTSRSATFAVAAQGFVAINITFQNTAGAINGQAVALRNGADLSAFYRCSFEGYQDTLYTYSLRQFYRDCDIYGSVDFIFGNAAVVFQNCNIYPRLPLLGQSDPITAQGRSDLNQNTGNSIQGGNIQPTSDLGSTKIYLGRPWKQYSRTVYMQSSMGGLIDPAGWAPSNGDFALDTLYYAEFNNTGPGSDTTERVTWPGYHFIKNNTLASDFTVTNFISGDDWLPKTGIPYSGGLL